MKDSTIYFDIKLNEDQFCYLFNVYNQKGRFFSNISFRPGSIKKVDNIIWLFPKYQDYKIEGLELFNFNLRKSELKNCQLSINDSTSQYELLLKDLYCDELDSIYWFRISKLKLLKCDFSNFLVSKKHGLVGVFESAISDSAKVFCINLVGMIPKQFQNEILIPNLKNNN